MISFEQACEKAYNCFLESKEQKGIAYIRELEDSWLFGGRDLPPGVPQYGNMPVKIMKNNGSLFWFDAFGPSNIEKTFGSKELKVPEKYKIK